MPPESSKPKPEMKNQSIQTPANFLRVYLKDFRKKCEFEEE